MTTHVVGVLAVMQMINASFVLFVYVMSILVFDMAIILFHVVTEMVGQSFRAATVASFVTAIFSVVTATGSPLTDSIAINIASGILTPVSIGPTVHSSWFAGT